MSRSIVAFSVFALAFALFLGCTPRPSTDPILIGHVAPFTGSDKGLGEQAKQGIELAVDEVNSDPSLLLNRRVEVLHVNSAGDDNAIADAAVRLITVNRVAALLGGSTAAQAEHLSRAAQTYNIPVVAPAGLPAPSGADNLFSVGLAPEFTGAALAHFSANDLNVKHAASITDTRMPFCTAFTAAFVREFSNSEERRVEQWTYRSDSELSDLAPRASSSKPQTILFAGTQDDVLRFRGHLMGTDGPGSVLFGGEEPSPGRLLSLRQDRTAKSPLYVPTAFAGDGGTDQGRSFTKKYRERFHQEPTAAAALAYDGARLLFQGIRDASATDGVRVRETLSNTARFDSLTGPISWEKDRLVRRPVFLLRVEKGTAELAKRAPTP